MNTRLVPVEEGLRIRLPAEWVTELGVNRFVTLEKTPNAIRIRPCPPLSWDEVFASKLVMSPPVSPEEESIEVRNDDLLF